MSEQRKVRIEVPVLARVEGEGSLELEIEGGELSEVRLRIFEPPRYFEKFLEGRHFDEVIDVVARICGICPVAYQVTAAQAAESAFGIDIGPWARDMRRALYCGEWLQSHSLHVHLLAAPDFLGHENAIALAGEYPDVVRRGLKLQGLGNDLISLFGGRSVHPVGVRVGGFHRAPDERAVAGLLPRLAEALGQARELVEWSASLALPVDAQDFTCVALQAAGTYAIEAGGIVSGDGLGIGADEYEAHFREHQEPHSTALFSTLHGSPYLVGPLARLNLNRDSLPDTVDTSAVARFPSRNMFDSLLARAIEIEYVIGEALRLLADYRLPSAPSVPVEARASTGVAATEAPRGTLWHRYRFDDDGLVRAARIVPPTSQNQARIEQDLRASLQAFGLDRPADEIRHHGETVIRNYDPCISCATHFLRLSIRRRG